MVVVKYFSNYQLNSSKIRHLIQLNPKRDDHIKIFATLTLLFILRYIIQNNNYFALREFSVIHKKPYICSKVHLIKNV